MLRNSVYLSLPDISLLRSLQIEGEHFSTEISLLRSEVIHAYRQANVIPLGMQSR